MTEIEKILKAEKKQEGIDRPFVSPAVIRRLPRYFRYLRELLREGKTRISSGELSARMQVTASQIRQDLNCFGGFGQQGYGYNVTSLREKIGEILGLGTQKTAILIGVGNLGRAICMHIGFEDRGFKLIGLFDSNPELWGTKVGDYTVENYADIEAFCQQNSPQVAILCIPKQSAHAIAEKLVSLGIKAFWNFSHYDLSMQFEGIKVENVHLADSLLTLGYAINN